MKSVQNQRYITNLDSDTQLLEIMIQERDNTDYTQLAKTVKTAKISKIGAELCKRIREGPNTMEVVENLVKKGLINSMIDKLKKSPSKVDGNLVTVVINWVILKTSRSIPFVKILDILGEKTLKAILSIYSDIEISTLPSREFSTYLKFLQILVSNIEVPCITEWLEIHFSEKVWLNLSKVYLRNLFLQYPSYMPIYKKLLEQQKSSEFKNSLLIDNLVNCLFDKLASLESPQQGQNQSKGKTGLQIQKLLETFISLMSNPLTSRAVLHVFEGRLMVVKVKLFTRFLFIKFEKDDQMTDIVIAIKEFFKALVSMVKMLSSGSRNLVESNLYVHYQIFQKFQRILFEHFKDKVESYTIKAVGKINSRQKIQEICECLETEDLRLIARELNIYVAEISATQKLDPISQILSNNTSGVKVLLEESLIYYLKEHSSLLDKVSQMAIYPTEQEIWDQFNKVGRMASLDRSLIRKLYPDEVPASLKEENSAGPTSQENDFLEALSYSKQTLQYIHLEDYFIRQMGVWKRQLTVQAREVLEEVIQRVNPKFDEVTGKLLGFRGWSSESVEVKTMQILDVSNIRVGESAPRRVLLESSYSLVDIKASVKQEWEKMNSQDTVFYLRFLANTQSPSMLQEQPHSDAMAFEGPATDIPQQETANKSFLSIFNIDKVRGATLESHQDENRAAIEYKELKVRKVKPRGFNRYLLTLMDPNQYKKDFNKLTGVGGNYSNFDLMVKMTQEGINISSLLTILSSLFQQQRRPDSWIENLIVGRPLSSEMFQELNPELGKDGSKRMDISHLFENSHHFDKGFKQYHFQDPEFGWVSFDYSDTLSKPTQLPSSTEEGISSNISTPKLNNKQLQAVVRSLANGISLIDGPNFSGRSTTTTAILKGIITTQEKVLVIGRSAVSLSKIRDLLVQQEIVSEGQLLLLGMDHIGVPNHLDYSLLGRISKLLEMRIGYLKEVKIIAKEISDDLDSQFTCETAQIFFNSQIKSRYHNFQQQCEVNNLKTTQEILDKFPLGKYCERIDPQNWLGLQNSKPSDVIVYLEQVYQNVVKFFQKIEKCRFLELLRDTKKRTDYLMKSHARIILMTSDYSTKNFERIRDLGLNYSSVVLVDAGQLLDVESILPFFYLKDIKRVLMVGDSGRRVPLTASSLSIGAGDLDLNLFRRLIRLNYPCTTFRQQYTVASNISRVLATSVYPELQIEQGDDIKIRGLESNLVFIPVKNTQELTIRKGEDYQNVQEAEFSVALYMYLRLQGYQNSEIQIQTLYASQKRLILEILDKKCSWHEAFGMPCQVSDSATLGQIATKISIVSLTTSSNTSQVSEIGNISQLLTYASQGLFLLGSLEHYQQEVYFKQILEQLESQNNIGLSLLNGNVVKVADDLYNQCQELFNLQNKEENQQSQGGMLSKVMLIGTHSLIPLTLQSSRFLQGLRLGRILVLCPQ